MRGELETLARTRPPVPLVDGMEWWVDGRYQLSARLRDAERRGEVRVLERYALGLPGLHGAVIVRLRPRRPEWHRHAGYAAAAGLILASGLVLIWLILAAAVSLVVYAWPLLLLAAGLAVATRAATGHRPTCAGLHCPGCRG